MQGTVLSVYLEKGVRQEKKNENERLHQADLRSSLAGLYRTGSKCLELVH